MRKQYTQPEMKVLEMKLRNQLLTTSLEVNDEETEEQW